jgi:hypothetical protein
MSSGDDACISKNEDVSPLRYTKIDEAEKATATDETKK